MANVMICPKTSQSVLYPKLHLTLQKMLSVQEDIFVVKEQNQLYQKTPAYL